MEFSSDSVRFDFIDWVWEEIKINADGNISEFAYYVQEAHSNRLVADFDSSVVENIEAGRSEYTSTQQNTQYTAFLLQCIKVVMLDVQF